MSELASTSVRPRTAGKSATAYRTISEVSDELDVPQHVLRFWETKFTQVRPLKRGGGRRYYRPEDVGLLRRIQKLLYQDGYTIRGVQRLLREGRIDKPTTRPAAGDAPSPETGSAGAAPVATGAPGRTAAEYQLPAGLRAELTDLLDSLKALRASLDTHRR